MKLANIFPKQALAPVLTAALSLASVFSPTTGNAEPARATTVSAPAPSSVSIPANKNPRTAVGSDVEKQLTAAYDHSNIGPSVVILVNEKEDPRKYVRDINAIKSAATLENVPLKVFGFTTKDASYAYILLDEMAFKKENGENYTLAEIRDVGGDALAFYKQSQRYKAQHGIKSSSASAPDVASNIR